MTNTINIADAFDVALLAPLAKLDDLDRQAIAEGVAVRRLAGLRPNPQAKHAAAGANILPVRRLARSEAV